MSKFSSLFAAAVFVATCSCLGSLQARETYPEGDSPFQRERARRMEESTYCEDKPPRCTKKERCDPGAHYEWTYKGPGGEWKVYGDWVYQAPIHAKKTLVADDITGDELMGLDDFGFKRASGFRAHINYGEPLCQTSFMWKLDAGFMANKWRKTKQITGAGNLDAVTGSTDYFLADSITVNYHTDLKNYEFNFAVQFNPCLSVFGGASAITLDEKFNMQGTATTTSNYNIKTYNRLYGAQAGFTWGFHLCEGFGFNLLAKGGIYWNDVSKKVKFRDAGDVLVTSYGKNKGEAAYAAEGIATFVYRPFSFFSIDAGYMIDWYSRVALAGKQFRGSVSDINIKRKIHHHGYFVHGFVAGASLYF